MRRSITSTAGPTSSRSSIERERRAVHVGRRRAAASRPPWFYLPIVLSDSFPWSLLLPCAAAAAWKTRTRIETLLWCWIAAIVGFFSLSAGKQDLYIFPIVPAVAALGGVAIDARTVGRARGSTWVSVDARRRRRAAGARRRRRALPVRDRRPRLRARRGADRRRRSVWPAASSTLVLGAARAGRPPPRCRCSPRSSPSTGRSSSACCRSSSATSRCRNSAACCRSACSPATSSRTTRCRCRAWSIYLRRHVDQIRRTTRRSCRRSCRASASTRCCRPTTTRALAPADRRAHLRHRPAADLRGEAAPGPGAPAAAGAAADQRTGASDQQMAESLNH